jgi:DNA-binding NarL/FixJ family response regulator
MSGPRSSGGALVIGYGALALPVAAHRRHGCIDEALVLAVSHGRACFQHLPPVTAIDAAGVTVRESDVLVLLLCGLTGPAIAQRLGMSPATVRAHCRALLRKLGAADRRALRTRLLGAPPP